MPSEVSYIRHNDDDPGSGGSKNNTESSSSSNGRKLSREEELGRQKDEFDTEDGFLAFALVIHNLLLVRINSYFLSFGCATLQCMEQSLA